MIRHCVWSEFIPYSELESRMEEFKSNRIDLFVAFNAKHSDFDGFATLAKKAVAAGVSIRPWLLLEVKDGYWFNKWNVEKNAAFARRFLREMKTRGVAIEWLIFDIEPPQELVHSLQDAFEKKNFRDVFAVLRESAQSASLNEAKRQTKELLDDLHAEGVKVHAVTTNFVLNDGESERIQNALGIPVTGLPFDEISLMLYRPEFEKILGKGLSSKIIELYAKRAKRMFGPDVGIDLGEAGFVPFPIPFQGFRHPSELQSDIAAVHRAGLNRIHVYSLDGMTELGLSKWLTRMKTKAPPAIDLRATLLVRSLSILRNLLPEPH